MYVTGDLVPLSTITGISLEMITEIPYP